MLELVTNPNVDSVTTQNNQSSDQHLLTLESGGDLISSKSGDDASKCPIDQLENDPSTPERSSEPSLEERIPQSITNDNFDSALPDSKRTIY